MTKYAEWVTNNAYGLIWDRKCGDRILGRIVFYTFRGSERASFWRALRAGDKEPHSCFTLKEAIDWVELEPPTESYP